MTVTYFKRFRMEITLHANLFPAPDPPLGYRLVPWHPELIPQHARVKYRSFRDEIDSQVFPCLGELTGCQRLMEDIAAKPGFVPRATWLALTEPPISGHALGQTPGQSSGQAPRHAFRYERDGSYFDVTSVPGSPVHPESLASDGRRSVAPANLSGNADSTDKAEYCGTIQGIGDDLACGCIQNLGVIPGHRGAGLGRALLLKSLEGFWQAGYAVASLEVTAQNVPALDLYRKLGFRRVKTVYKAVEVAYSM